MSSGLTPSTRSAASSTQPAAKMSRPWRSRSLPAATAGGGSSPNHSTTSCEGDRGCRLDAGEHEGEATAAAQEAGRLEPHVVAAAPRLARPRAPRAASSIRFGDGETMARRAGPAPDRAGTVVGAPPKSVPTVVSWAARSSASRPCSSSASNRNDEGASGADADASRRSPSWCSRQARGLRGAPR